MITATGARSLSYRIAPPRPPVVSPDFVTVTKLGVLPVPGTGSEDLADAHVVAAAIEAGGGVILTIDDDLNRLAAPYRTIVVERLVS